MSDDAFVRAILARPGDDALRLVYADWLEEAGDVARSEYLRLLCRLSGASPPAEGELTPALARLDELRAGIDHAWVGLMHRGRFLPDLTPHVPAYNAGREGQARRRPFNEAEVGVFLRQYARRGCNDRSYSRKVEKRVKRMKPEDLDRLVRGEEE